MTREELRQWLDRHERLLQSQDVDIKRLWQQMPRCLSAGAAAGGDDPQIPSPVCSKCNILGVMSLVIPAVGSGTICDSLEGTWLLDGQRPQQSSLCRWSRLGVGSGERFNLSILYDSRAIIQHGVTFPGWEVDIQDTAFINSRATYFLADGSFVCAAANSIPANAAYYGDLQLTCPPGGSGTPFISFVPSVTIQKYY